MVSRVLPEADLRISIIEDVLSTRIMLQLIRGLGYNLVSRVLMKLICTPLKYLERTKLIDTDYRKILICPGSDAMFGSYCIELRKF